MVCSLTESGTKWALKICLMYFLVIFMFIVGFKARFVPFHVKLEISFLYHQKGHKKTFPVMQEPNL